MPLHHWAYQVWRLTLLCGNLEAVDFISVVRSGDKVRRIDIRVPEFRSGYTDLGERWKQLKPSEIEQASINVLNLLYKGPNDQSHLMRSLGLGSTEESIMFDVMESGLLIASETVDGQPLIYTPLAVDGNPSVYLRWAEKFPSEVGSAINTLRNYQGMPITDPTILKSEVFNDAVMTGVLMPVKVSGATGDQKFLFAPHGGLSPEEAVIMDKARALIGCVRYGQKFAEGRRIKFPRLILEQLRSHKRFKKRASRSIYSVWTPDREIHWASYR